MLMFVWEFLFGLVGWFFNFLFLKGVILSWVSAAERQKVWPVFLGGLSQAAKLSPCSEGGQSSSDTRAAGFLYMGS